jgi:hypothetical protein
MEVWAFAFAAWICAAFGGGSPAKEDAETATNIVAARGSMLKVFIGAPSCKALN